MKTKKKIIIKIRGKNLLTIGCFKINELCKSFLNNYVSFLKKNKFIFFKPQNYLDQISYLRNINDSKDKIIFSLKFNKIFVGTIGVQKNKKNFFFGIIIFEKKIRNKGFSKYFLYGAIRHVKNLFGGDDYFAGINRNNIKSINLFKSLGFKCKSTTTKNFIFFLNYKKIKTPNYIVECIVK
jgi:hypothetical protein